MNTILQKRIEEKSKELAQKYFPNEMNILARPNYEAQYVESACKEIATFTLQNQWISVEEELLPYDENGISKEVIVRTGFNTKRLDRYFANCKEWEYSHKNVTHWMPIPSLEGGEE